MKQCCQYLGCNNTKMGHIKFHLWLKINKLKSGFKSWLRSFTALDYSQIEDVIIDGIDHRDSNDFSDAYIVSARYKGRDMTESELERLNEDQDYVYECTIDYFC